MRYFALTLLLAFAAYRYWPSSTSTSAPLCAEKPEMDIPANTLIVSKDAGASWQLATGALPEDLKVMDFWAIDGELYLGSEHSRVFHSGKPGVEPWQQLQLETAFSDSFVSGMFTGKSVNYATIASLGLFRQMPGTRQWESMNLSLPDKMIQSVTEASDGAILVATSSGIYRTADGGRSWEHPVYGWTSNLINAGEMLLASGNRGIIRSNDQGKTWEVILADEGTAYQLHQMEGGIAALRLDRPDGNLSAPLYFSTDGGNTWERREPILMMGRMFGLQSVGKYLFCTHSDGISRSEDGGKSWELVLPVNLEDEQMLIRLVVSGSTVYGIKLRAGC